MDKYIGKKLDGRYEIRELIGVGGMANVYKAYDVLEDRIVAVKILREEYMDNDEFMRRFRNESRAISLLDHPNIVKVYDVIFSNRIQSIVMEYIDGITLKDYIDQEHVLRWKEAVHFTVQILKALQHAHDKGIVHRDVKPHNIMLLSDGSIKITDFGIARFSRSNTKTITDKAIGSVHYISPEQASGACTDARSDLYSLGVMMFEMLTGKLPFEADSLVSVAIKQIQSEPIRPRSINPDIPEGLEEIVMRAMQKDAFDRLNLKDMLLQPEMLDSVQPDVNLVSTLMSLNGVIPPETRETARLVVRKVVQELLKQLEQPMRSAVSGALNRAVRNRRPRASEIDWNRTIQANLRHWQEKYHTLVPETEKMDYPEAMDYILSHTPLDPQARHVLVAHGVVTGDEALATCDSERSLSIGGTEFWQSEALADFDYVALGHLHQAQRAGSDHIRYAGSLMQYSFSEEGQQKVMLDVELDAAGKAVVAALPLTPLHQLVTVQGTLDALLDVPEAVRPHQADYLRVILEDEGSLLEPMQRLKQCYPNIMVMERRSGMTAEAGAALPSSVTATVKRSPLEMFTAFYEQMTDGAPTEEMCDVMAQIFAELRKEEP